MRGRELLPIARLLLQAAGKVPTEPAGRSTVNRAYYAAFGEASEYASRIAFVRRGGGGSHDRVWRWIGSHSDGNAGRDAIRLTIESEGLYLKARRHKADYHLVQRV